MLTRDERRRDATIATTTILQGRDCLKTWLAAPSRDVNILDISIPLGTVNVYSISTVVVQSARNTHMLVSGVCLS